MVLIGVLRSAYLPGAGRMEAASPEGPRQLALGLSPPKLPPAERGALSGSQGLFALVSLSWILPSDHLSIPDSVIFNYP